MTQSANAMKCEHERVQAYYDDDGDWVCQCADCKAMGPVSTTVDDARISFNIHHGWHPKVSKEEV